MPLPSRSIHLAVLALLPASIGLAQPQPASRDSDLERLRAAYEQQEEGSFNRSVRSFESLLDPDRLSSWDPVSRLTRNELLSQLRPRHNPDRDLAAFVDAYASSPHAPYAHIHRGLAALQRHDNGQARIHFDEAVAASAERDPQQIDDLAAGAAYYWLGIAHLTDRDGALHAQAADALRTSCDVYPRNPFGDDACFALGQMYEERGELDSAITFYDRLIERYPASENRIEAALRAAQSHLRLHRIGPAQKILAELSWAIAQPLADRERQDLQTAEYHLLNAVAHERAGDFASAERSYLTVVYSVESPYRRTAMLGLADTYRSAGHVDSATAIYRRILRDGDRDAAAMNAELQLALIPLTPPYTDDALEPLRRIALDTSNLLSADARLTLAGLHYLRQDFPAAAELVDSSLERSGSYSLLARGYMLRGAVALATSRYREADDAFARALNLLRTTPVVLLPERDSLLPHLTLAGAIAMIHAGRPSEAVPQLNRLLETQPSNAAEASYWLGEAYYAAGVLPAAVQTMEDLIERFPASQRIEDALYTIGWAQFKQRKLERAEAAFARLVKAYPLTVYATSAYLRRGDCLYLDRKYAEAADAYASVDTLSAHSDLVEYARYQSALAWYHAEKRETSRDAFRRFAAAYPESALADDAVFMAGLIEYLDRSYAEAVATLSTLTRSYPSSPLVPRARATMAGAYYALGEFDSSRTNAESVVRDHPQSSFRSEAQSALERADNAIGERDRRLARERERSDDAFERARAMRDKGDLDAAIAELERLRGRASDDVLRSRTSSEIAACHFLAGDSASAVAALRTAARAPATEYGRRALWTLGDYFRDARQPDSAASYYRYAAAASDSLAPLAHLRIGQTYLGNERWSSALEAFTMVVTGSRSTPQWVGEANLGIGEAHVGKGDRKRAREIFQQLIRDHAGDDISRRAEEQLRALGNL